LKDLKMDKSGIKKILFISLSNIGDAILTLPSLGLLTKEFPGAGLTVICGKPAAELFQGLAGVSCVIPYDKRAPLGSKLKLLKRIMRKRFDMVVDLRNSLISFIIPAKFKTDHFVPIPKDIHHMSKRHLFRLKSILGGIDLEISYPDLAIDSSDDDYVLELLRSFGFREADGIAVVACGGRSSSKLWKQEGFAQVCRSIQQELKMVPVLAGDSHDRPIAEKIVNVAGCRVINLCGLTSLKQLVALLKRARFVISNDSAVMHLSSALKRPLVAIFGPTDEKRYGPQGEATIIIRRKIPCAPCRQAQCRFKTWQCLVDISAEEVFQAVKKLLLISPKPAVRDGAS
jgi:ADP-heptose:LPS heptosyltransferase